MARFATDRTGPAASSWRKVLVTHPDFANASVTMPSDRPNFLIIMTDEHNPFVSEPFGHPFIQTPNIQRLADRGVLFENTYCNAPLCVPSRASFMTGKYVHRIGVWDNAASLSSNEPTWAPPAEPGRV